jgi:uncharacterized protein YkwD
VTRRSKTSILVLAIAAMALLAAPSVGTGAVERGARVAGVGCPGQSKLHASFAAQERTMLCLVNRARRSNGLAPLVAVEALDRAADSKSADIIRCGQFNHEACGREFTYWMTAYGYEGCALGENIAWGSGKLGTPGAIFRAWMKSPGHRSNILGPYAETGIGLRIGRVEGFRGAHVWTQEFGSRSC